MTFDDAFKAVIGEEGAFNNDPNDRGNWTSGRIGVGALNGTKYGVSAMAYPDEDIANLTLARAKYLFKRDYWDNIHGDSIPGTIAFGLFDSAVNEGVHGAVRAAQIAMKIPADGIMGPATILALQNADVKKFARAFATERVFEYAAMALWVQDHNGWVGRVLDVYAAMIM